MSDRREVPLPADALEGALLLARLDGCDCVPEVECWVRGREMRLEYHHDDDCTLRRARNADMN